MSDSKDTANHQVLRWPGKLFSADDLRRHWHNERELVLMPRALLTPLAQDELRALGVRVTRQENVTRAGEQLGDDTAVKGWGYLQEKPDATVAAAVAAVARAGITLTPLAPTGISHAERINAARAWVKRSAGAVFFCGDAALCCCLANKSAGVRAAAVSTALHTGRALLGLGANLLVVEMPGRTYFEVRQILRTAAGVGVPVCPADVAQLVLELEDHAHR